MKQIIKIFNNLVKQTIFKAQNKTNHKLRISNFNKYLITFISLLFGYVFYLLIPLLYDKSWVQSNIESKFFNEFKINLSTSADISYRILPAPHFLIKNSKISLNDSKSQKFIADIRNLKVFLAQKNFFLNKEKMSLKEVIIDSANFSLLRSDFQILNEFSDNKFSNKKIKIDNSNIFFKNNLDDITAIIKINKAVLFFDNTKLINLFNLRGNVFGVPFKFRLKSGNDSVINKTINVEAKSLKLGIFNEFTNKSNESNAGKNIISFTNSKINTKYNIKKKLIIFESNKSKLGGLKLNYNGELSINPFDLDLNIHLNNFRISKLFSFNTILKEFIKSELLFNDNLSLDLSIFANNNTKDEIFNNAKINFNIVNGKLNLDNTILTNDKIGLLELSNSNLFLENNELVLKTDVLITIKNSEQLFSTLNTGKKDRKKIEYIFINLDYKFLSNQIKFNNIKIDNNKVSNEFFNIIEAFNDNDLNNTIKSRRWINKLFNIYEG